MPRRSLSTTSPSARYLQRRVTSPAFARELTALVAGELRALADQKFKDVIDTRLVRELIERSEELLAVDAIATLALSLRGTARQRVRKTKRSLRGMLGEQFVADVEAAFNDVTTLTPQAEELIDRMMQRELVQGMMTDLVYTAIVSFNRRVNPLFGNLALMAVDAQIKSFIRMFMPMLQRQATSFLIDRKNHALFTDFARAAARQLLNEPLSHLFELFNPGSDAEAKALTNKIAHNPQVRRLVRDLALALADAVFQELGARRVGSVLLLDDNIDWLAKRLSAPILAALQRAPIATFVGSEIDRAVAPRGGRTSR